MSNNTPKYNTIHVRLRRRRGPARQSRCAGCSVKRADQWAYDHRDPDELVNDAGLAYSADLERYIPLCVTCHRRFDEITRQFKRGFDARLPKPVEFAGLHWLAYSD